MAEIIRDSVDGVAKYCRIPVRRRRTAMYSYELEELLQKYMQPDGAVDEDAIKRDALELFNSDQCEDAGLLCSTLDFIELMRRVSFGDGGDPDGR